MRLRSRAPRSPATTEARMNTAIATGHMSAARTHPNSGRGWKKQKRRFGPLAADENDYDGSEDEYNFGTRKYVGKLTTPEFEAWLERQRRREAEDRAAGSDGGGSAGFDGRYADGRE